MTKLLAFAASSSTKSINKKLVDYAVGLAEDVEVEVLDLNDYELPLYSEDKEAEIGSPDLAAEFFAKIGACDALIISYAEHNGGVTAAFKNLFDWCSRIDQKVYQGKPMLMMATSPGGRGAQTVLNSSVELAPHFGGDVKASVSVPFFQKNYDMEAGTITNAEIREQLQAAVGSLLQ